MLKPLEEKFKKELKGSRYIHIDTSCQIRRKKYQSRRETDVRIHILIALKNSNRFPNEI